jgi:VWFA-related protein
MTRCCFFFGIFLAAAPLLGQPPATFHYKIDFDPNRDVTLLDQKTDGGAKGLFVKVRFSITVEGAAPDDPNTQYKILVEENGHKVHEDDVPRPTPVEDLSVVLAMDTSGSMNEHGRMEKARAAAEFFLNRLPKKADCGLILFDHEIRSELPPKADRKPLLKAVGAIQPRGGTAFLDAGARGIAMLAKLPPVKQRYLVLMTDGVDINSKTPLPEVIKQARAANVRILTIGIGEPGRQEKVSTVLVLDQSGSMRAPADREERKPKIQALHRAASRFVEIMPTTGSASILPFSSLVGLPSEFTNDRPSLIARIKLLRPEGETALLDATYAGIGTLDASRRPGKQVVVAMTDGIDNSSRRRLPEVIDRAKEAKVPVYTLGFGREGEVDQRLLKTLAEETGGRYYHARNEKSLLEIFENLSIQLHDDGIDEIALTQLAQQTGGQYFPVKNIGELELILQRVTETIQHKEYEITFPSLSQKRDGTHRLVNIKLVRRTGEVASNTAGGVVVFGGDQVLQTKVSSYQTRGLVVAEMHPLVYLIMLLGIGMLLLLPAIVRSIGNGRHG